MELLLGETLEARRQRFGGRLPWPEVVRIGLDVLDVLDVVHARGLLHRDVKPSNVLFLDDGSLRLIDFGIAKTSMTGAEVAPTRTGTLPGSLAFMSPEHAIGVPGEIDARSDLWSLGATMFLLLAGKPVHEGQTEVGALALAASRPARSLGAAVSGLPAPLVAVVDRALSFDRRGRFASAAEMRAALAALDPEDPHVPRARPGSRWRLVVAAAAVVAIGGAAAASARRAAVEKGAPDPAASVSPSREPDASAVGDRAPEPEPRPDPEPAAPPPPPARSARRAGHDGVDPSPPSSATPSATVACDPPFYIDPGTGTRRVKPGC